MTQQVLVPTYVGHDDRVYYTYVEETAIPEMNRFNVGDKVNVIGLPEEYTHTIDCVSYDLDANEWVYYVQFDPHLTSPDPRVQSWLEGMASDPNERAWWFDNSRITTPTML